MRAFFLLLLVLALSPLPLAAEAPRAASGARTVGVTLDFGDGHKKDFPQVPCKEGASAWDVIQAAAALPPGFTVAHTGNSLDTIFITQFDAVKNEGGGSTKRNWQFWVNGKYAQRGVGTQKVENGDKIVFKFALFDASKDAPSK